MESQSTLDSQCSKEYASVQAHLKILQSGIQRIASHGALCLSRCRRGLKQQTQSEYQVILWISHPKSHKDHALS